MSERLVDEPLFMPERTFIFARNPVREYYAVKASSSYAALLLLRKDHAKYYTGRRFLDREEAQFEWVDVEEILA